MGRRIDTIVAMNTAELLTEAFGRVRQLVQMSARDLSSDDLAYRPDPDANSIAWLTWHLTRTQDDHVSEIAGREQAWVADGWVDRFGFPFDPSSTGHGHTSEEVAAVRTDGPDLLIGYHEAVSANTVAYLESVDAGELGRIIDASYDPPVTVGVRLVSVLSDNIQHGGQARYVRGMLERR